MENENGKDCAFPNTFEVVQDGKGLTKREIFAMSAMQGLLSNPMQIDTTNFEWIATHAKGYADQLLKVLED